MNLTKHFYQSVALLVLASAAFVSTPLFAQTADPNDDALRPLIVRPTDGVSSAAPAPIAPPSGATITPISAPTDLTQAAGASDARLRLPPPPAPSQIDLNTAQPAPGSRTPVRAPVGQNMFADFGPPSGSSVSDRVFQLRDEAIGLRQAVDRDVDEFTQLRGRGAAGAIQFHSTVAAITARLEAGTTRGNPILQRQWSEAEQSLTEVNYSISKLNLLSTTLSASSSQAAYLLQAIKAAFELSGALDEDHDQLAMIRDEVAKSTVNIDRIRGEINDDIRRQNTYLATERQNLQVLALSISRGELIRNSLAGQTVIVGNEPIYGTLPNTQMDVSGFPSIREPTSLSPTDNGGVYNPPAVPVDPVQSAPLARNRSALPMKTGSATARGATPVSAMMGDEATLGQLLVLVRFNEPQVDYEDQMYQAVSTALDRKPDANFTVVAVSPKSNDPAAVGGDVERAERNAENVKSSLIQLGLQPNRISMSNISSEAAQSPEVHLYIR
ncbi:MAG: hypothetical protein SFW65_07440 [Alphaproteobacteria bacterium]|nr:hypothetical protein [Alphaproteobacteria bacterium]